MQPIERNEMVVVKYVEREPCKTRDWDGRLEEGSTVNDRAPSSCFALTRLGVLLSMSSIYIPTAGQHLVVRLLWKRREDTKPGAREETYN